MRLVIILAGSCLGTAAQADLHDLSMHGDFKKIYFIPAPEDREVEVRLFVPVGEVDVTGPEGLAHYLEHLVARSADEVHGDGLRNRIMNAWAAPDWTGYWNRGPAEELENMIRHTRAAFEPVDLSERYMLTERDIVEREYDFRLRNNPTRVLFREAYQHLYGSHGLGRSVMGTPESIRKISPQDALAFHEEAYNPRDAYLLIYGPVSKTAVVAQIRAHLLDLPEVTSRERPIYDDLPEPPEEDLVLTLPDLARDKIVIVGHAVAPPDLSRRKLWFTTLLVEAVLNSHQKGGLAKPLFYDEFIVSDIDVDLFLLPTRDIGFEILFGPEEGTSTETAIAMVKTVLRGLADTGVPSSTYHAIRDQRRAEIRRLELDSMRFHATVAQQSILNLGKALDVKGYHYEWGRPTLNDVNMLLAAIAGSTFTTTAIAQPEVLQ